MTPAIETILHHRSIRKFTDTPISESQMEQIFAAGRAGSSSNLIQCISIIRVTDKAKRSRLAELGGNQPYIESAAEFLVFCIDYQRHHSLNPDLKLDSMELTLIGAVDATIMAQNCLLAAESMGLGGVYIGGLRNNPLQVDEVLELPEYCAVLYGMCLGHPDQAPDSKPRFSTDIFVHENTYQKPDKEQIAHYDQVMSDYYRSRSSNTKDTNWSESMMNMLSKDLRPHMLGYFHAKGLAKK
ncbi:oxygen-insensitive NADPH nitroreductase [Vibrio sp. HA2012]|uniref:oxygen-insensitive NADPH nitroreductase n=1 Tax=Vibrio sp. HA2012 TaxID=1971595 RepID=UPI000C2B637A|nr:oxygen-insensitive NADPH nitroreductase [Vibrio sp. HA2012]PJC87908.1 oxygen-insensitive NADPH nitroreductase [Vibrio sp. HA2012]